MQQKISIATSETELLKIYHKFEAKNKHNKADGAFFFLLEQAIPWFTANPHAGPHLLHTLAQQDISLLSAEAIARSPFCGEETLYVLWRKHPGGNNSDLRYIIAEHPNAPLTLLDGWAWTQSAGARKLIAKNPKTTANILLKMLEKEQVDFVISEILQHKNLPAVVAVHHYLYN